MPALRPRLPEVNCPFVMLGAHPAVPGMQSVPSERTLGRSVCLGQVDAALAHPGCALTIRLPGGAQVGARVHDQPAFVDPEGVRLRG